MGASLPVCADGASSRGGGYKCCIAYIIPVSQEQFCVKRIDAAAAAAARLQTTRSINSIPSNICEVRARVAVAVESPARCRLGIRKVFPPQPLERGR
jgi:hypothetical protein